MITGASAVHDCLHMLSEDPEPDLALAKFYLGRLQIMLGNYEAIQQAMVESGDWELFPAPRRSEMEQTHSLVKALQRADVQYWNDRFTRTVRPQEPSS